MTTQELHISIDLLLQKMSSNWNKNFLPQELDIIINREITKFLKQRINPLSNKKRLGMYDTLKRIRDTNTLTKSVVIPILNIDQEEAEVRLPLDFLYPIGGELKVTKQCSTKVSTPKMLFMKSFKEITDPVTTLVISLTPEGSTTTTLFNLADLPSDYLASANIGQERTQFILNNAILIELHKNLPEGFICRFNNKTREYEVSGDKQFQISLLINGNSTSATNRDIVYSATLNTPLLFSSLELIDEEFSSKIKHSALSKSKEKVTKGYLRADNILVPYTPNVVYESMRLTYICKPTRVDLLLNSQSELPDDILEEVISNTVEALKAITSSDTYEKYVNENSLIE